MEALREPVQDSDLTRGASTLSMARLLAHMSAWHYFATNVMATLPECELNAWVAWTLEG